MISPEFNGTPSTEEYRAYLALLLREVFIGTAETVPLYHAAGRILAQDVTARMDVPSFDNSQMDGYALTAEAAGREDRIFTVGREIPAGRPLQRSRSSDDLTYPIMTGAPMPKGYDAVIPVEQSERIEYPDLPESFGRPSEKVKLAPGKPGQFVRRRGEDVVTGQVLARAGERVTPALLGALASQGYARLTVAAGPRVLVCTGGDEILSGVEEDGSATTQELGQGQIFDANGPMLTAMLREDGAEVRRIAIGDDPIELLHRLTAEYESFKPDIIITSGGISHGKYEVVHNAIAKAHEADILVPVSWFGHVSQQPGGPQGVNVLAFKGHRVPMISFPGNPVSTLISYALILRPYLRAGGPYGVPHAVASEQATLNNAPQGVLVTDTPLTAPATKRQFLRGTLAMVEVEPGTYRVELYPDILSGSHLLHRAAQADVLIELAPGTTYTGGEAVHYHRIRLTDN